MDRLSFRQRYLMAFEKVIPSAEKSIVAHRFSLSLHRDLGYKRVTLSLRVRKIDWLSYWSHILLIKIVFAGFVGQTC